MYDAGTRIQDFLSATAAKQPTPGGGSITALVGALAAATGEMVVNYSIGKKGLESHQDELKSIVAELSKARQMLQQLMVEDQLAYEAYTAARKLPPDSPERKDKLPAAIVASIRVPQTIAATAVGILELCDRMVGFVNFYLLSDLAVAADLAMATVRCAIYSVRSNLKILEDPADRRSVEATIGQLLMRSVQLIQRVAPRVWDRDGQGV
ncbi:MAG: cyclodeaminase/cyclohydrolase family protein [Bacillota bacterium]